MTANKRIWVNDIWNIVRRLNRLNSRYLNRDFL